MNSSFIKWTLNRVETFVILGVEFDIQKAKSIIVDSPRLVYDIEVEKLRFISRWPHIYKDIKQKADLSIPIIMAKIGRGHLPIDGWHRIHKALSLKEEVLSCVFLTSAETRIIQI